MVLKAKKVLGELNSIVWGDCQETDMISSSLSHEDECTAPTEYGALHNLHF